MVGTERVRQKIVWTVRSRDAGGELTLHSPLYTFN